MRIVVLGAGSLGSLYAAWSTDAGHEVCIVTRAAHADMVNEHGLRIIGLDGIERAVPIVAVSDVDEAPDADVVLLASKANDTAELLDGYRGAPIAAWSIQNGARQAEPLVERFGEAAVGCSSMIGATLVEPGVIAHTFTGSTYLGALDTSNAASVGAAAASVSDAAAVKVRGDISSVLWSKAVLATAAMGVSILLRLPYHHVFVEPEAREVFYAIVADAARVAAAEGIELVDLPGPLQAGSLIALTRPDALARLSDVGEGMVAAGQTSVRVSMLQSLESGRRLEAQAVFGDLIDLADQHGLEIPVLRSVAAIANTLDQVAGRGNPATLASGTTTEPPSEGTSS
jgi:2-dehydropantoate 2-reductase